MVNPLLATAIEQLDYCVTVGEASARAGLDINTTQSGLLTLASDVGANLQVAESGEVAYLFPRNYRAILRRQSLRLRLQELWQQIWSVLFYLIRISFGIFLGVSITLIFAAIAIIVIAYSSSDDNNRSSHRMGFNLGSFFWIDDLLRLGTRRKRRQTPKKPADMNFLEAVFSVLFGDGNPNANLEQKRWQLIGGVIRQNQGAITAEQVMPYLDLSSTVTDEDFMIPILSRFNGYPKVTERGELIYHFPNLQTSAVERQQQNIAPALQEKRWTFAHASSIQVMWTVGLGVLNVSGAIILETMLSGGAIALGGFVGFVNSILWLLLAYGIGFLAIPLGRYFWVQQQNRNIQIRNQQRMHFVRLMTSPDQTLQQKLDAAKMYQNDTTLSSENIIYTTEQDLIEQSYEGLT